MLMAYDILAQAAAPASALKSHQLPQLGLPSKQSFYLQHLSSELVSSHDLDFSLQLAENLARIGLAMDYEGNGYRKWIRVAASDSLLLDTILAVTISHYARWQRQASLNDSHIHYRQALKQLRGRLQDPVMVRNESTLAAMMFLISYEVRSCLLKCIVTNPPPGIQWLRPMETASSRCAGVDQGLWVPGCPRPVLENMV